MRPAAGARSLCPCVCPGLTLALLCYTRSGGDSLGIEGLSFEGPDGCDYLLYSPVDPLVLLARPGAADDEWLPAFDEAERAEPALQAALRSLEAELDASARDL